MKLCVTLVLFVFSVICNAQSFKDDISVVQFSAPFTKSAEISLKPFDDNNIYTFYIDKKPEVFKEENIKYLPTIILYHNGEEVVRVESGITLKLPEDTLEIIEEHIEEIIESKF
ncbi:MAG: hypothetical protein GOVbin2056_59 [Prokaryotic dsDNA virus sp.]|nr:MAG: hypothetical protein GOVbin2056_59 [Prokaryotic dsDNA virus sp.]|tara:strand:+ start:4696 stop:5037 length:342 start_codon:yes stop_codon:yes gene_type:complete